MKCLKKYLFLFVACFCFLSCKNVFAESFKFTADDYENEQAYTNLINYMRSRYNFNDFVIFSYEKNNSIHFFAIREGYIPNIFHNSTSDADFITFPLIGNFPSSSCIHEGALLYNIFVGRNYSSNTIISNSNSSCISLTDRKIRYSTIDIKNTSGDVIFSKNYELKKDDTNKDDGSSSTDKYYHPTKEEFMLIPSFLALLIMMLFFKWCFPGKGGKNL